MIRVLLDWPSASRLRESAEDFGAGCFFAALIVPYLAWRLLTAVVDHITFGRSRARRKGGVA